MNVKSHSSAPDPDSSFPSRLQAVLTAAVAVAAAAAGWSVYRTQAPHFNIIAVELGGHGQAYPLPAPTASALRWDFVFIAGYGAALVLGTYVLATWVAHTQTAMRIIRLGQVAAVVTIAADCLENAFLLTVTGHPSLTPGWRGLLLGAASTSAVVKFCAFLPAAAIALTGTVLTVVRCVTNSRAALERWSSKDIEYRPPHPVEGDPDGPGFGTDEPNDAVRWRIGFDVPPSTTRGDVGFCLSGGGIRAGSVALGVLQEMRPELTDAQYLVSVSGGGYTAGAFVQALTDAEPPNGSLGGTVLRDPSRALSPGSVEEDHVRRHSSYLADSVPGLLVALGLALRHLVLSLTALFAPAVVAGVLVGWFYKYVPVAYVGRLHAKTASEFKTPFLIFRIDALIALGVVSGVATVLWLCSQGAASHNREGYMRLAVASKGAAWLALVTAAVTVAIPVLASTAAWLFSQSRGVVHVAIGGPVGGVLLTYLATLASVGWRNRAKLASLKPSSAPAAVPTGVMQRLLVAATLILLAAGWLLLFAGMVLTQGDPTAAWTALGIALLAVVLGAIDETTLSLHPFYRARLASAFAARAVRRAGDGRIVAEAYRPDEHTLLSRYGRVDSFPATVFAATANLSGEERTPPGRNAASYTFSAEWVGGPDVGWIRTSDLERLATPRLRRDLTVQAAVAISGAAFASAMGRSARWFQIMLAISGARLGAWLPNPAYVKQAHERARSGDWRYPRLPRTRRLGYLLREIFDVHPHSDRLLQITDGGHYENLGLVELLRRRCRLIYCVDASGDSPPTATTLSQAIALAHDELGVTITLDKDPFDSEPGSGTPIEPKDPLSGLNSRLSQTPIITGTITYPPEAGVELPATGQLFVAKTLLTQDMPYWLLSYAAKHTAFPHDSTGDQWFDSEQFSAYTELGRQLGMHIRARTAEVVKPQVVPVGEYAYQAETFVPATTPDTAERPSLPDARGEL